MHYNLNKIDAMREGGKYLHAILHETGARIKPGVNVLELEEYVDMLFEKFEVTPSFLGYQGYPSSLCISVNDEVVHSIPKDYVLTEKDIITLDCGVYHQGFHTDSAVTFFVGKKESYSPEIINLVDTTERALQQALSHVHPGVHLGDISFVIGSTAKANHLTVVQDLGGHGIGKEVHMEPYVANFGNKNTGPLLKVGMTLAIEPIFCLGKHHIKTDARDGWTISTKDGSWSAQFEHTICVTETGCEILT